MSMSWDDEVGHCDEAMMNLNVVSDSLVVALTVLEILSCHVKMSQISDH